MTEPAPDPPSPVVPAPRYELPGARHVVGRGLGLALVASAEVRRASLHAGLLVALLFGPPVVGFAILAQDVDPTFLDPEAASAGPFGSLILAAFLGILGLFSLFIDAQSITLAILGGRHVARPLDLHEAVGRARQSFWPLLGSSLLVGLVNGTVSFVMLEVLDPRGVSVLGQTVVTVIATLATAPFIYSAAGIVLGGVGAIETLGRSVRLVRARPRIAVVLVAYPTIIGAVSVFAIGGAIDVVARIVEAAHLALSPGIVIGVGGVGALLAFGSLIVTIDAIVAAPQVVAFVGLTHYSGGLDRARRPVDATPGATPEAVPEARRPRLPLVSRPMAVVLALDWLLSVLALGAT